MYLTPAALSYLAQFILASLISIYFFTLNRRQAQHPPHLYWLTACRPGYWLRHRRRSFRADF